jgi:hypothetical protein
MPEFFQVIENGFKNTGTPIGGQLHYIFKVVDLLRIAVMVQEVGLITKRKTAKVHSVLRDY